mmetsp:Transcript_12963/g.51904  ORF Transcript_12963/g.51904 Transcript_12963/m.51904 type:complete len:88 (+) Transcript_12963:1136-1399(+)
MTHRIELACLLSTAPRVLRGLSHTQVHTSSSAVDDDDDDDARGHEPKRIKAHAPGPLKDTVYAFFAAVSATNDSNACAPSLVSVAYV